MRGSRDAWNQEIQKAWAWRRGGHVTRSPRDKEPKRPRTREPEAREIRRPRNRETKCSRSLEPGRAGCEDSGSSSGRPPFGCPIPKSKIRNSKSCPSRIFLRVLCCLPSGAKRRKARPGAAGATPEEGGGAVQREAGPGARRAAEGLGTGRAEAGMEAPGPGPPCRAKGAARARPTFEGDTLLCFEHAWIPNSRIQVRRFRAPFPALRAWITLGRMRVG